MQRDQAREEADPTGGDSDRGERTSHWWRRWFRRRTTGRCGEMGDAIRSRLGSGVILLAAEQDGQARFIVTVDEAPDEARPERGQDRPAVGERLGGRGGGRPDSAQGGSNDTRNLRSTIAEAGALIA